MNICLIHFCLGTNLQALIDRAKTRTASFEIVLVISNVANVGGLKRAEVAGIATQVCIVQCNEHFMSQLSQSVD